ncbi:MAG: hypothetical protein ACRD96_28455 [Bryobacteraceae bacterium]
MPESKRKIPPAVVAAGAIVLAGVIGFNYLVHVWGQREPANPVLTPEARAYVRDRSLQLSGVEMKAAESYLKQAVVEINGRIGNQGGRRLSLVEINCVFRDPYAQVVLRERVPIVGRKTGPLGPGENKNFRLAFDNIPPSWNNAMPELVIAQIVFE